MDTDKCKIKSGCLSNRCEIIGIVFLVIATVLTLITLSGMGIFGMFLVGVLMCCHKHYQKCPCACGCCSKDSMDSVCCDKEVKK